MITDKSSDERIVILERSRRLIDPLARHRSDERSLALVRLLPSIVGGQLLHLLTAESGIVS
jgi:hypothetical protein